MSGGITFGATITGGIQNIAGLLPLLGTQQCEEHIGSALTKGYLYAAATPMSIFGSLGVARAGFKTLIACIPGRTWSGAMVLANMGFEAKGINLSLVMVDRNDNAGRHLAETRLEKLMKELHVDKSRVTISHKCARWNFTMLLLTAFLSSLGMVPYIHINRQGSNLAHFSQWTFPILRAVGGFLTASMMQIVIQRRIDSLTANRLATLNASEKLGNAGGGPGKMPGNTTSTERHPVVDDTPVRHASDHSGTGDVEKGLGVPGASDPGDTRPTESKPANSILVQHETAREHPLDWIYLFLLLVGILSSVTGYVGCFSVVQNAKSSTGPLSWLCLEAGLSFIRMILWGLNPKGDDAPPLELILRLDHGSTFLPTCNLDDAHILQQKILPLTRANQFLNMITSFVGLVERFTHPDLTLYYTLTRKQTVADAESLNEAGRRVLYITLFDHKERTTRVYTRDGTTERFYSTESDVPLINLRHGVLEIKLHKDIISQDDLIAGDPEIHSLLRNHYQSIMDQIHFTLGETADGSTFTSPAYTIENKWTLKASDTIGARERTRLEDQTKTSQGTWASTVETGRNIEVDNSQSTFHRDLLYFEHRRIEEMRQSLDAARGQWIHKYMGLVTRETRDRLEDQPTLVKRVDEGPAENNRVLLSDRKLTMVVEEGFINERLLIEKLLVYEIEAWEWLVWSRVREFMGRDDVPVSGKERIMREWRGNCWKRLDASFRAMDARMVAATTGLTALPTEELQSTLISKLKVAQDKIQIAWKSVIERLVDTPIPSASSTPRSRFNADVRKHAHGIGKYPWRTSRAQRRQHREMTRRLEKELADVEFRMAKGLDRCDEFYDDEQLLHCRHSRSKTLFLHSDYFEAPQALDSSFRALKGNIDVIRIDFYCDSDQDYAGFAETIRDLSTVTLIQVLDRQLLPPIQRDTPLFIDDNRHSQSLETFLDNDSSLARSRDTYVFMQRTSGWTIAVSFIGPSSGNLILKFKHRAYRPGITLTTHGISFSLTVPESFTVDEIHLHSSSSDHLSFMPNIRNNLILQTSSSSSAYTLYGLQLLDEDGNPYGQRSQPNSPAIEFDAVSVLEDRESWDFVSATPDDRQSLDSGR